jgi:hypothetical protein
MPVLRSKVHSFYILSLLGVALSIGCGRKDASQTPVAILDQAERGAQVGDTASVNPLIERLREIGPPAVDAVKQGLHSASAPRRTVSVYAAEMLSLRQLESDIVPLISDGDMDVRGLAIDACINLGLKSSYAPLRKIISSGGKSAGNAINGLAKVDVSEAAEAVCEGYAKLSTQPKEIAVSSIARSGSNVDRATIQKLLQLVQQDASLPSATRSALITKLKNIPTVKSQQG